MVNKKIFSLINEVRKKIPLIYQITNYVTVKDCANAVLAIGGSPIMADDKEEAVDIVSISKALVINIGTLNKRTVESMILAGETANKLNIPVILDPVGAGASELRNNTVMELLGNIRMSVIRGNISEIRFVTGNASKIEGVNVSASDALRKIQENIETVKFCSKKYNCVTVITGAIDVVGDGEKVFTINNGHPMMSQITGTGCMLTAVIGCFCGVSDDYLSATLAAVVSMGIAGEIAFEKVGQFGVGSFNVALLDALSKISREILKNRNKLNEA
jgi:hydroxyethylthiazole kinase